MARQNESENHSRKVSEFDIRELFYSRTDPRGVIKSGNAVFERVSKYSLPELLGKPHSIVRHPDMPRGVFYLLWDHLLSGRPIGAYVLNLAKDKSEYWVFALAFPVADGFLSVRMKPSSPVFNLVKDKYRWLLNQERERKLTPQEAAGILLGEIKALGFTDYDGFMAEALTNELESRSRSLGLQEKGLLADLRTFLKTGLALNEKVNQIDLAIKRNSLISLNMDARSGRIGNDARAVTAVSAQFRKITDDVRAEMKSFFEISRKILSKIRLCQFTVSNYLLQSEMASVFLTERTESSLADSTESALLKKLAARSLEEARAHLGAVGAGLVEYLRSCGEVRQLMTALEIVSVSGKIEVVKADVVSHSLVDLMRELDENKNRLKTVLSDVELSCGDLLKMNHAMLNEIGRAGDD